MIEHKSIFQEKSQEELKVLYEQYLQWEQEGIIVGKELNEISELYRKWYDSDSCKVHYLSMMRYDLLHAIADLWYVSIKKSGINMVKLKVGSNILEIDKNDLILDNGMCYQIITKRVGVGYNRSIPVMSKKMFDELKKCGLIFTTERLRQIAIKKYGNSVVTFWKFDVEQMQEMGY